MQDPTHKLSKATLRLQKNTLTESCDSKMSISGDNSTVIEIDFENSGGRIMEAVFEADNELTATMPVLYDFDGNILTNDDSGISCVETTLKNNSDIDKEVYLFFTQYDKAGTLIHLNMTEKRVKSGEKALADINGIIIDNNAVKNKIFIWDKQSLCPVRIKE